MIADPGFKLSALPSDPSSQGGLPHLIEHLWSEFTKALAETRTKEEAAGVKVPPIIEITQRATATSFVKWASEYLKVFRPVENFYVDANHGLRLSNNVLCVVSPGLDVRGTMQEAHAIGVTHGKSQHGQDGIAPGGGLDIR